MKISITDVYPHVVEYFKRQNAYNNFHIFFDDGNIKDKHILACMERCEETDDLAGLNLGELLLQLSKTQRKKLINLNLFSAV